MSHSTGWKEGKDSPGELSEQDLQLGKRAVRITDIVCIAGFLAAVGISIYVLLAVPMDTRIPFSGKRDNAGLIMPIIIVMTPIILFFFWRSGKTPKAHMMNRGARIRSYLLAIIGTVALLSVHVALARALLIEGGAL